MARVLLAYLSESQYANLEYGMTRGIWGLPLSVSASPPKFDYVFISSQIKPGGPRRPVSEWENKTLTIAVAKRTGPMTVANSLLWPDELADGKIRYKHRFSVKHLATRVGVRAGDDSILPRSASIEIRSQAVNGGAPVIRVAEEVVENLIRK